MESGDGPSSGVSAEIGPEGGVSFSLPDGRRIGTVHPLGGRQRATAVEVREETAIIWVERGRPEVWSLEPLAFVRRMGPGEAFGTTFRSQTRAEEHALVHASADQPWASAAAVLGWTVLWAIIGTLAVGIPIWWMRGEIAAWREILRELPIVTFALSLLWLGAFLLLGFAFWLMGRRRPQRRPRRARPRQ
jgi:hypothetical protein